MKRSVTLEADEREMINCLIEKSIQKEKLIKYVRGHGFDIRNKPFEYDKETGTVFFDDHCCYD